ncbi:MAG: hypothetical protein WCB18_07945 [Thermoplasmata archaeon]
MSFAARHVPRAEPGTPVILESALREPTLCRCGTHLRSGVPLFIVEGVPASAREVFEGRVFCSVKCIRAFCLESLETLDGLDTKESKTVVTDLHDLYQGLAESFARILLGT